MFNVSCVSHAFLSVHCCLWSPAGKGLTSWLLLVMFIVFFVTFPCGILGQVSFPDLCLLSYFEWIKCPYLTIELPTLARGLVVSK